ncbi:MAG TPA: DNA repair protein RecN [Gemmatimonadaceae bacterium]|nr:DNA repair protein RecN [Gemmatimonadaceae bacterium]
MLTELRIRNFAIIESLSLPLERGFNVLSGETGAGKSIIVGALGLLLGERASADLIRTGAERATVEGVFDIAERKEIASLLDEHGIEADEPLVVLKREIASSGRTRAWVNGSAVSATLLADIGRHLVNLHGQHEAQALLDPESQRHILDVFAGATEIAAQTQAASEELSAARREIADLQRRKAEAERRADYLRHVAKEIEDAKLIDGEDARLEDEARRLENAEELRALASGIASAIDGEDEAVLTILGGVERHLSAIQRIDPMLSRLQELYDSVYYNLEALARELEEYENSIDLDPTRLDEVRARRDLLFRLTKKYGGTLAEVIETGRRTREELDLVDSAGLDLRQLETRERDAKTRLEERAAVLTELRRKAAKRMAASVDQVFPDLGMPDGHFVVRLTSNTEISLNGAEDVEFRVSLNIGHEERALSRVASGGELSRVMLALKTILARLDHVPTLVFDEVDAGIGGRVGLMVGETMRRVAAHHQVFAITHLPQIAARAHHHILVAKGARGGVTTADVAVLSGNDRISEVARMLSGDPESDVSRAHARELLDTAAAPELAGVGVGVASAPAPQPPRRGKR